MSHEIMTSADLKERITYTKSLILKYEAAIDAVLLGGMSSYELDTGQSKQKVTKFDAEKLNKALDALYNRCATLQTRLSGAGNVIGRML